MSSKIPDLSIQKPVNSSSNPGLKVNLVMTVSFILHHYVSLIQFFEAFVLYIGFVIIKLKLEGQTIQLFRQRLLKKSVKVYATMSIGIMGSKSLALID